MSEATIRKLVEARLRVVNEVNSRRLSVSSGAKILGITRQGLWKLGKSVEKYGSSTVTGRKRGPKAYKRPHNRTEKWIEDTLKSISTYMELGQTESAGFWKMLTSTSQGPLLTGYWSEEDLSFPNQKRKENR